MRGVDLLLARPGLDAGSEASFWAAVAGGGDPAANEAALVPRLSRRAALQRRRARAREQVSASRRRGETSFNYAAQGSWESTRKRNSGCRSGDGSSRVIATGSSRRGG